MRQREYFSVNSTSTMVLSTRRLHGAWSQPSPLCLTAKHYKINKTETRNKHWWCLRSPESFMPIIICFRPAKNSYRGKSKLATELRRSHGLPKRLATIIRLSKRLRHLSRQRDELWSHGACGFTDVVRMWLVNKCSLNAYALFVCMCIWSRQSSSKGTGHCGSLICLCLPSPTQVRSLAAFAMTGAIVMPSLPSLKRSVITAAITATHKKAVISARPFFPRMNSEAEFSTTIDSFYFSFECSPAYTFSLTCGTPVSVALPVHSMLRWPISW